MPELARQRSNTSTGSLFINEHASEFDSIAGASSVVAEVYLPCQGTWSEFVGDTKRTLCRAWAAIVERVQDFRDGVKELFHRKKAEDA